MSSEMFVINGRFNGPPSSGNGGYVCGKVSQLIDGDAEVMLRQPPPLDKPLSITRENNTVRILDDDTIVAIGRPTEWTLELPPLPSSAEIMQARMDYPPARPHPLPTCFVYPDSARCFSPAANA